MSIFKNFLNLKLFKIFRSKFPFKNASIYSFWIHTVVILLLLLISLCKREIMLLWVWGMIVLINQLICWINIRLHLLVVIDRCLLNYNIFSYFFNLIFVVFINIIKITTFIHIIVHLRLIVFDLLALKQINVEIVWLNIFTLFKFKSFLRITRAAWSLHFFVSFNVLKIGHALKFCVHVGR